MGIQANLLVVENHNFFLDRDINLDEPPIETKTAPQGSTVIMECKTDLEPPVNYLWTKQGRGLPNNVDVHSVSIAFSSL